MINKVIQLIEPGQFIETFRDIKIDSKVIIRPTHLAICKADQRYYLGMRPQEILDVKLPMALIHEAIGEVVYDPADKLKVGTKVIMIPNTPFTQVEGVASNYVKGKFRGSGFDGFTQEFVDMDRELILPIGSADELAASMLELLSVCHHGVASAKRNCTIKKPNITIIGDGPIGYFTFLIAKKIFKGSTINVIGRYDDKLDLFTGANCINSKTGDIPNIESNIIFECVGGAKQNIALEQAINYALPEANVFIMGISETNVNLPVRALVEKGITLVGRSRSNIANFKESIELIKNKTFANKVKKIIGHKFDVNTIKDLSAAFNTDANEWKKTVLNWKL